MNRDQILSRIDRHCRKLKKGLKLVSEEFNPDSIHEFRVEYKKLRAFLRMISSDTGREDEFTVSRGLKKAYHIAGSIRDLQLQQQRVAGAFAEMPKKPQSYLNLLQREIEKLKPELPDIVSGKPVIESRRKIKAAIPGSFHFSNFPVFFQRSRLRIQAIMLSGDFSDENIHTVRKILKDIYYNLRVCSEVAGESAALSLQQENVPGGLDTFLEELGKFQDQCRAIALLKEYWIISLNRYNQQSLHTLKSAWIKEKTGMKQGLVKKMKTLSFITDEQNHSVA